jgi:hypothetical protein
VNHMIRIEFDPKGNFTYVPSLLRVEATDTVQWRCLTAPFTIMFKNTTPFVEGMEAYAQAGVPSTPLTVADVKGHFHYAVAVFDGTRVLLDAGCPGLVAN